MLLASLELLKINTNDVLAGFEISPATLCINKLEAGVHASQERRERRESGSLVDAHLRL